MLGEEWFVVVWLVWGLEWLVFAWGVYGRVEESDPLCVCIQGSLSC